MGYQHESAYIIHVYLCFKTNYESKGMNRYKTVNVSKLDSTGAFFQYSYLNS